MPMKYSSFVDSVGLTKKKKWETKNENINRWSGSKNSKTKLHVSMECYYAFVHSNFNLLIAPLFSNERWEFGCQVKIWLRKLHPFWPLPLLPTINKKMPRMMLRSIADITNPNPHIYECRGRVCERACERVIFSEYISRERTYYSIDWIIGK